MQHDTCGTTALPMRRIFISAGHILNPRSYERQGVMQMYMGIVMLLGGVVDFLLLMGTNRMCGYRASPGRCALGAVVGGLHSCLSMLWPLRFLRNPLWRAVSMVAMALIGFGMHKSTWRRGAVFTILSLALYGITQGFGGDGVAAVAIAAVGVFLLCIIGFRGRLPGQVFVPVEILQGDTSLQLTALRDTGNTLQDPVTGQSVLVIDAKSAGKLTGLTKEQLEKPVETMGAIPGLRLVPYHTVGKDGGLMLAMKFQNVKIGKWKGSQLVAFAPEGLGGTYDALTGGVA